MIRSDYKIKLFGRYLLRRFVRIEPPYLVTLGLGILYLSLRNFFPSSAPIDLTPSFIDILLHLGYFVPFFEGVKWISAVFWTLAVEFQYYIFLSLLFPLVLSNNKILRWTFNLIVIVIPFFLQDQAFFIYWASYFGIGIFYTLFITNKYSLHEFVICMILSCCSVFIVHGFEDLLVAVIAIFIIHFFSNYSNKVGIWFGKISYSLYLLHSLVGLPFINIMSRTFKSPIEVFFVITGSLALSILSAYILWKYVEKPTQKLSKKIKLRKKINSQLPSIKL